MNGTMVAGVRFTDLFADTVRVHGIGWTLAYYRRRGMTFVELRLWARVWLLA